MLRWTLVLAAAFAAAHPFARAETGTPALVPFNWTLDSTTPLLQYAGAGRWSLPSENGTASFVDGSTVSLSFVGTDLFMYGTVDPGTKLTLTLDDTLNLLPEPSDALLARTHAEFGHHTATLTLVQGGVSLHNLTITTGIYTAAANNSRPRTQPFISENNRNSFYHLDGPWSTADDAHLTAAPGAEVWATVPPNSSYLVLRGSSLNASTYTASLRPAPYGMEGVTLSTRSGTENDILYMAPLDPSVQYLFDFAVDPNGADITLQNMTFYSSVPNSNNSETPAPDPTGATPEPSSSDVSTEAPSSSTKPCPNLAAIIGGSVGGGVALILLILLCCCCCRSRSAPKENDADSVKPHIELPANLSLHSRSQSVLGIGSILEHIMGSGSGSSSGPGSHRRGSTFGGSTSVVSARRDNDREGRVEVLETIRSR